MPTFEQITRHSESDPSENPWINGPPAPEAVEIVPYDPDWPHRYQVLSAEIRSALGDPVLGIEHIGSTSVEGLSAKDVIDIDLTVADPRDATPTPRCGSATISPPDARGDVASRHAAWGIRPLTW